MSKEAMKLALEALKTERDNYLEYDPEDGAPEYIYEAITALEFEVAKQEQGEPVAEIKRNSSGQIYIDWRDGESAIVNLVDAKLYTTQQQRKPIDLASAIKYADARWAGVDVPVEWLRHFVDGLGGIKE